MNSLTLKSIYSYIHKLVEFYDIFKDKKKTLPKYILNIIFAKYSNEIKNNQNYYVSKFSL